MVEAGGPGPGWAAEVAGWLVVVHRRAGRPSPGWRVMFLLAPDGHLLSRRWRYAARAACSGCCSSRSACSTGARATSPGAATARNVSDLAASLPQRRHPAHRDRAGLVRRLAWSSGCAGPPARPGSSCAGSPAGGGRGRPGRRRAARGQAVTAASRPGRPRCRCRCRSCCCRSSSRSRSSGTGSTTSTSSSTARSCSASRAVRHPRLHPAGRRRRRAGRRPSAGSGPRCWRPPRGDGLPAAAPLGRAVRRPARVRRPRRALRRAVGVQPAARRQPRPGDPAPRGRRGGRRGRLGAGCVVTLDVETGETGSASWTRSASAPRRPTGTPVDRHGLRTPSGRSARSSSRRRPVARSGPHERALLEDLAEQAACRSGTPGCRPSSPATSPTWTGAPPSWRRPGAACSRPATPSGAGSSVRSTATSSRPCGR